MIRLEVRRYPSVIVVVARGAIAASGSAVLADHAGEDRATLRAAVRELRGSAWAILAWRRARGRAMTGGPAPPVVRLGDAWPFPRVTDAYKAGARTWFEISEERAGEMLEVVPPRYHRDLRGGFFMGEPSDHVAGGRIAVHLAVVKRAVGGGRHFCREIPVDGLAIRDALADLEVGLAAEVAP